MNRKSSQIGNASFNVTRGWRHISVHKFGNHDVDQWVNVESDMEVVIWLEPYSPKDWLVFVVRRFAPLASIIVSYFVQKMLDYWLRMSGKPFRMLNKRSP